MNVQLEVLRSGFLLEGDRLFLYFDRAIQQFRVGTPWRWLAKFPDLDNAGAAYEAIELIDLDVNLIAQRIGRAVRANPAQKFSAAASAMARVTAIVSAVESH